MTMPGVFRPACSVAQFNRLGMALDTGIEQCPTLPSKAFGTNYGKPAQSRAPNRNVRNGWLTKGLRHFLVRRAVSHRALPD
jgi:hypothetical protein